MESAFIKKHVIQNLTIYIDVLQLGIKLYKYGKTEKVFDNNSSNNNNNDGRVIKILYNNENNDNTSKILLIIMMMMTINLLNITQTFFLKIRVITNIM